MSHTPPDPDPSERSDEDAGESAPSDPRAALGLIERTREHAERELGLDEAPLYVAWGVALLVAFGVTFLQLDTGVLAGLPAWTPAIVWPAAIGAAATFSAWHSTPANRGVDGHSQRMGRRIGLAWTGAMILSIAVIAALPELSPAGSEGQWFIAVVLVFAVAVMYLAMGAVFVDDTMLGTGLWFGGLNAVAILAAPGWYGAIMAVGGGGGLLAAGALSRRRRAQRRGQVRP